MGACACRLSRDVLESRGRLRRTVADQYQSVRVPQESYRVLRGHKQPVTCLCVSPDDAWIFTGAKDASIIKWNAVTGKREHTIVGGRRSVAGKHPGHTDHITGLAMCSDGSLLASCSRDANVIIWNPTTYALLKQFSGHRGAVMGVAFRTGTRQLYSCGVDRSVKIWNCDEMAYVDTLFGHQDAVLSIDSLSRDRPVSGGGLDSSVRVWKVVEVCLST
jgi:ribosomal RNA-processing protein 9